MYITDDDILIRAEALGYNALAHFPNQGIWNRAEEELEEEHLNRIYEVWSEVLDELSGVPYRDRVAMLLLKGWTDDMDIYESVIYLDGEFYFGNWEIRNIGLEWEFENVHTGRKFLDVSLLIGLQCCDIADSEPEAQKAALIRKYGMDELEVIQLERYTKAVRAELQTDIGIRMEAERGIFRRNV